MENLDNILLFKTNICTDADREVLCELLKKAGVVDWHLDREDCDKVLRIVSSGVQYQTIIQLVTDRGYECCELT